MLEKLRQIEAKYADIARRMEAPEYYSDPEAFAKLAKEQKELAPLAEAFRDYLRTENDMREARDLLSDPEMRQMAQEEYDAAKARMQELEEKIKVLLLPRDPNDSRNVIVEIRGGVGGEESALFAASLYRMYAMYAETKKWKTEIANLNETELGGIKEISFIIEGDGAYSRLKFESGVHRVQRVPETEAGGRIHTSTATVAVLPEMDEVDFAINPADLQIDTYRASGAGGQHVNKTESAIRITHLPTGTVVECQDERSQYKNKDNEDPSSRLYTQVEKQNSKLAAEPGARWARASEHLRTYNF
jgi:peptide chain release factor 1